MADIIIIGAGGHAKVVADIVVKTGNNLLGFLDDNDDLQSILDFPVLGRISKIEEYKNKAQFVFGIGSNILREKLSSQYCVEWATLIHPSATVGIATSIGEGTVVCAQAAIGVSAQIGSHCILNTGAIVDHDNIIENYAHISANVICGGTVHVGERTFVGIGVSIRNNIIITSDCVIGAGAAVVQDIQEKGTYIGVPARRL